MKPNPHPLLKKSLSIGLILFAIAWIGVGIQHFMYLKFVATLVPAYMPVPLFWAALTGLAMILAGISFLLRVKLSLTATLLTVMMLCFVVMIHIPKFIATPHDAMVHVRALQDLAIMAGAMMLIPQKVLLKTGQIIYVIALLFLGAGHFSHLSFITAKVPEYLPFVSTLDIVTGIIIIILSLAMLVHLYARQAAFILGVFLLLFALLYSAPILIANPHAAVQWTTFLLALAVSAGAYFSAATQSKTA